MNVLFYVGYPLAWAKGGYTTQIEETKSGLERLGIRVHWLHHECDEIPDCDLIHYWSRPPNDFHWQLSRRKNLKLVLTELHPATASRPKWTWSARGRMRPVLKRIMGTGLYGTLGIGLYTHADAVIAVNSAEAEYMNRVFGADPRRIHVIPNGVDPVFFDRRIAPEPFDGLVCLAYIKESKHSIELARRAKEAKVPIKFVGNACFSGDRYLSEFRREVDNRLVFWEGEVLERERICAILRGAKGCILASEGESQPIALLESLACGTPVMGPDLTPLKSFFGDTIRYAVSPGKAAFAGQLAAFYRECGAGLKQSFHVLGWGQVAEKVAEVYEMALAISR